MSLEIINSPSFRFLFGNKNVKIRKIRDISFITEMIKIYSNKFPNSEQFILLNNAKYYSIFKTLGQPRNIKIRGDEIPSLYLNDIETSYMVFWPSIYYKYTHVNDLVNDLQIYNIDFIINNLTNFRESNDKS